MLVLACAAAQGVAFAQNPSDYLRAIDRYTSDTEGSAGKMIAEVSTDLAVIDGPAPMIADLKVPVVFDHIGNADAALGVTQRGFGALVALVKARNTYVKLSAPDNLSTRADWADVVPLAKALIAAGPDRMLFGTNWPNPGRGRDDITKVTPYQAIDNAKLLTHFVEQCPMPRCAR